MKEDTQMVLVILSFAMLSALYAVGYLWRMRHKMPVIGKAWNEDT